MNIITRIDNSVTTSLNHWGINHVGLVKFLSDQLVFVEMVAGYNRLVFGALLILTLISGLARVSAGIHYPSDIVAGLALGWVVAWVYQRVLDRVG